MKKENPFRLLEKTILLIMLGVIAVFSFLPLDHTIFAIILVLVLLGWSLLFYINRSYSLADIPLLFLWLGTFSLGKAFSILSIGGESLPLYVTEITLALALGLLVWQQKSPVVLWKNWVAFLPKSLVYILPGYILLGTVYLVLGVKANGAAALRDIVICHYSLWLFIMLSVLGNTQRIQRLWRFFVPGLVILFWAGFKLHYLYKPLDAAFRQFVSVSKATNFTLYFGLVFIFGLCFLPMLGKKMQWLTRCLLFFSLLFVIAWESRTAWVALIVALIFLAFLLKKEFLLAPLLIVLMIPTLFAIDYFQLGIKNNKIATLGKGLSAITQMSEISTKGANIKFRLRLWKETGDKIKERPLFGWGFGVQIDYLIWGTRLSELKAKGLNNGILPPHNHILAVAHKMGIFGLALFLFINGRIFFAGLFYLKECTSPFHRRFLIGALAGLLYWHGMAFLFDILESPPTGIFLWLLLGCILALIHADKSVVVREQQ